MTTVRRIPDDHPTKSKEEKVFPVNGSQIEEALDDMDDVGIDGFDDEEDGPPRPIIAVPVPVPEPPKRAPRKAPPRAPPNPRMGMNRETLDKAAKAQVELDEFLAGLDFGNDQHRIIVSRLEPTHDTRTGEPRTGILKTFYTPITGEDIQKAFGGGLYELRVMGPDALTGRKNVLRKRDTLRIAGKPKFDFDTEETQSSKEREDERDTRQQHTDLFLRALESKEKEVERLAREAREAQRLLLETALKPKEDASIVTTVMSLMKEQQTKQESNLAMLMESMREERRLDEERRREERRLEEEHRREERKREEDRRREEREEARLVREAEARRHEKEMEILRQNAQREAQDSNKSTEVLLRFMEQSRKEESERSKAEKDRQDVLAKMQFDVMQQGNRQAVEMVMESSKFQMGMLQSALQEAKSTKRGGISEMAQELIAFREMQKTLSGEADEEPESTVDKIFNRIEGIAPSLATAATTFLTARAQQPAPQQAQLPPPTRMALVDQGPVENPAPRRPQARNALVELPETPEEPQETELAKDPTANDFTAYTFPKVGADVTEVVTTLVKNLDFAVSQGVSADDIADDVLPYYVKNFPTISFMLKGVSADDLVKFIEERVPPNWAIASPAGEKVLRELHAIVKDGG